MSAKARIAAEVAEAFAAHQAGRLDEAERLYQGVLRAAPQHFDALHMLGALCVQRGEAARAAEALGRAVRLRPQHARAHFNLGLAELRRGDAAAALAALERAHVLDPRHPATLHSRGNALAALGRDLEALDSYGRALALAPGFVAAWQDRARVALRSGRPGQALDDCERALALAPGVPDLLATRATALADLGRDVEAEAAASEALSAWRARHAIEPADPTSAARVAFEAGLLLAGMKRYAAAAEQFREAQRCHPGHVEAMVNEANVLAEDGQAAAAEAGYRRALEHEPRSVPALLNLARLRLTDGGAAEALGLVERALALEPGSIDALGARAFAYVQLQQLPLALADCEALLAVAPGRAEAYNVRGLARLASGEELPARVDFEQAIALQPTHAHALLNLGLVCRKLGEFEAARGWFERVLAVEPRMRFVQAELIYTDQLVCDWRARAAAERTLAELQGSGDVQVTPFSLIAALDDPALQRACARYWSRAATGAAGPPLWAGERYDHGRIRVAYLSADLCNHATTTLIAGLFEVHDRERFEIIGVSFSRDDGSDMQRRVRAGFDSFLDVRADADRAVAERLRALEVDIAVDLKGHTMDARPGIFAHRPAPVQVSYLGYPGTSGASFIDYLVADEFVIPPQERAHYDECIVFLPDSYQVNDRARPAAAAPPSRAAVGLPETGFVFCSFNNNYKITPAVFAVWLRLLAAVPGSVLWLLEDSALAARNLRQAAAAAGTDPGRLVFAPRRPLLEHLARQRLADLFLDTLPCNAHTTASDALWAGLPVLTCAGRSFPARVAGSLLGAAGLDELITHSLEDYEALAVALARDAERLGALRSRLEAARLECPLFDTARFARRLESAYETMVHRVRDGLPPADLHLPDGGPGRP